MVSFSCEGCGDVLTKKKLDSHRNQCYGASFTCLDCMVHFQGTEYRAHTSCISEAQKYQGALYRPEKEKKKQNNNRNSQQLVPQKAYFEEVPDDYTGAVSRYEAPPEAPEPPSAAPDFVPNVFDFLVGSETPNPSTLNLVQAGSQDESRMIEDTPQPDKHQTVRFYDDDQAAGMIVQYGTGPVPTADYETVTPAPSRKSKHERKISKDLDKETKSASKDKKRKRLHVDTSPQPPLNRNGDLDEVMEDADGDGPPMLHSGLTGGLNRLLRPSAFPPSPDYSGDNMVDSPGSPLKRSKRESKRDPKREGRREVSGSKGINSISDTIMGLITGGGNKDVPKKDRERDSNGSSNKENDPSDRPRTTRHRDRHVSGTSTSTSRSNHRGQKLLEYNSSPAPADQGQMVLYDESGLAISRKPEAAEYVDPQERAELFLSFVTKSDDTTLTTSSSATALSTSGGDSGAKVHATKGYSINKALKRYHRERGGKLGAVGKKEAEEKALWKCLRLKRNEAGECVVFFAE